MEIVNAIIEGTNLGYHNGSILTFYLFLDYGGSHQNMGGYALDKPMKDKDGNFIERKATAGGLILISKIIDIVGVQSWEELKGEHIRVAIEDRGGCDRKIYGFGNIIKDKWLYFEEFWKEHWEDQE